MSIENKLQKLIDGKQYVIDKVNAKSGSNLTITSKWQDIGDSVENITSGGGNSIEGVIEITNGLEINRDNNELVIKGQNNTIKLADNGSVIAENLTASNIVKDVNILGVTGTFEGGGSGTDYLTMRLNGTTYEYSNSDITEIPQYAFYYDKSLKSIDTPNVVKVGERAFYMCQKVESINLPNLTTAGSYVFFRCEKAETINVPNMTSIGYQGLYGCDLVKHLNLPKVTSTSEQGCYGCYNLESIRFLSNIYSFGSSHFANCYSLKALIIGGSTMTNIFNTNTFNNCYHLLGTVNETYNPNGDKDCFIYVHDNLLEKYKSATNWATYADQIKPISELPQEYKDLYGI